MKLSVSGAQRTASLKPGVLSDPKFSIKPYTEESVTAGYNGYGDVAAFRNFLVLNQFLDAFHLFKSISANLAIHTALELLRDDVAEIGWVRTLKEAAVRWVPAGTACKAEKANTHYQIAFVLYNLAWIQSPRPISNKKSQRKR